MDPRIVHLKSTTFFGRRFTRKQIAAIQETVATFPALSRKELAQTICEHLRWRTPAGTNRVAAALRLLEALEQQDILTLPPKREERNVTRKPIEHTGRTAPQPRIEADLRELTPLRLQLADSPEQVELFNEYIDRHHYLGYRQPLGPHLRYFLRDRHGRPLGCLLFSQASRELACRDQWVGWQPGQYKKHLHLVVSQPRFLLLPWVSVKNLASHALALAVKQLPQDWQRRHRCRPVLIETFVNSEHFAGTCYRAANWLHLGQTQRRREAAHSPKDVYVYVLDKDCRQILLHGPQPQPRPRRSRAPQAVAPAADYVALWQDLIGALSALAADHDRRWQLRRRVLNTLLVMLFVFRLVFAPRRQGYTTTLAELWDQCRALEVPLPQPRPVHEAAMVRARRKIDPAVFRQFHAQILLRADPPGPLWNGRRVFAVDGSKLTLPRPLLEDGYRRPNPKAHYPLSLIHI